MSALACAGHRGVKYSTVAAWGRKERVDGEGDSPQAGQGAPRILVAGEAGAGEPGRPSGGAVEPEAAPGMAARAFDAMGAALLVAHGPTPWWPSSACRR